MQKEVAKIHAKFSASIAERILNCPASVAASETVPPLPENSYAKEGTEAHACLEFLLKNLKKPTAAIQTLLKKYPEEMVHHAREAVEKIIDETPRGAEILSETKVSLSFIHPEAAGTLDAAIVHAQEKKLVVIDYKYGMGIPVEPKNNSQLLFYALGLAHKYNFIFEKIRLVIIQPRAEHENGPIRAWELSKTELQKWGYKLNAGIKAALDPLAQFVPGTWCKYCPAKIKCPAVSDLALKQAEIDFAPSDLQNAPLPIANMIKPEKLSEILKGIDKLEVWIEAVKLHAQNAAERGVKIPGFKLVQKRSTRKWINESKSANEAYKKWGDSAFTNPELLTPHQLEKICKPDPKWLAARVSNESSGTVLVTEDDKRPEVSLIDQDFGKALISKPKTKEKK